MWEVLKRTPRGTIRPRKFNLLLATLMMASFAYAALIGNSTAQAAADATWVNNTISYKDKLYEPIVDTDGMPTELSSASAVYEYINRSESPAVAHFIYFAPEAAAPQAEKEATYIRYTLNPPNTYTSPIGKTTLSITPLPANEIPSTVDEGSSCTIDGIGWLVCPLMNGIAEGMDYVFEMIRGFLVVEPLSTDVNNPVYRIWQVSRDIANVLFVIGFLVIIYHYIVGGGFNAYQIRKVIPRIVIAAILINASYIICAVAVDISNILGYSVNQLFETVRDGTLTGSVGGDQFNWKNITAWILAGGVGAIAGGLVLTASVAGAAGGLWFILAPFLLGGALIVMVTFLILAARQAIIIVAIAIAPLAFAAFILPNTEKWFERWRSLFLTMLIMFPAFAAVFGGAQLAGDLIIRMAAASGRVELIILGLGVMVAPLAITPLLLKLGGGVLSRFGGIVNNPQRGLMDRFKNYNQERLADHVARNNATNAKMRADGTLGVRPFRRYAAHSYAKNNYRSTQRKLNDEAAEDSWHNQTGRWGYDSDRGDNENGRHGSSRNQGGRGNLDLYKRDNQLRHGLTEAHHNKHWQDVLNTDSTRRGMQTDTRITENKAKIIEEAHQSQDDRTFQTALNTNSAYSGLRDMKVQASVNAGIADTHKAAIDSAGKLALSTTIANDRDLRVMKVDTHANEKKAEVIENTLQKKAEANWSSISRNDESIQKIRLEEVQAVDKARRVEEQWNTLVENVAAKGADAPQITLRNASVANSIMGTRKDIQIEAYAQDSAKRVQQDAMSGELKTNETLRAVAGGVGGQAAANRIYAKAKKDVVGAYMEDVSNSRSVLSEYSLNELVALHQQGIDRDGKSVPKENTAMRDAAMQEILMSKGNNWAFQKTKDYVSELGMIYDENSGGYYEVVRDSSGFVQKDSNGNALKGARIENPDEIDRRRDIQQLFVDAASKSKLKIASFSGTDRGNSEVGTFFVSGSEAIVRDIRDRKINANRIAGTDVDELQRMIQVLRSDDTRSRIDKDARDSLVETINFALTDPQVKAGIGQREAELMGVISQYLEDDRRTIPVNDKLAYEKSARTRAPYNYQSNRVNDYDDGKGPDGSL